MDNNMLLYCLMLLEDLTEYEANSHDLIYKKKKKKNAQRRKKITDLHQSSRGCKVISKVLGQQPIRVRAIICIWDVVYLSRSSHPNKISSSGHQGHKSNLNKVSTANLYSFSLNQCSTFDNKRFCKLYLRVNITADQ